MATRGETVINELLTKVGLVGAKEATAAAQAYDKALDGVSVSSDQMTKAQLSTEKALSNAVNRYSEVSRAAAELAKQQNLVERSRAQGTGTEEQRMIAIEGATNRLTAALQRQAAAQGVLGPGLKAAGDASKTAANSFGLTGYQIQGLAAQFSDLAVQIGSGQGLFRPLLQQGSQIQQVLSMSEGGMGGALKGIGAAISRIGPLGIAAFGTAGVLGAVGAASAALASHGAELERQEARLRAFSSRAADVIAIAQRATAGLGVASTGGFRDLTEQVVRFGQAMGVVNVETFISNFARLSTTMHATAEESDAAAAAFAKLAAQGNLTSGDLISFAEKFPQFAKVAADAMGVTTDQLLTMSRTIPVVGQNLVDAVNRGGAAANANVRPWNELSNSVGRYMDALAKAASSSLDAFLDTTAKEVYGLASAWDSLVSSVDSYITAALKALGIQVPSAPAAASAQQGSTAPQAAGPPSQATMDAYWKRNIVGGKDIGNDPTAANTGQTATGVRDLKTIDERAAEEAHQDAQDLAARHDKATENSAEWFRTMTGEQKKQWTLQNNISTSSASTAANTAAMSANWDQLGQYISKSGAFDSRAQIARETAWHNYKIAELDYAFGTGFQTNQFAAKGPMTASTPGAMNFLGPSRLVAGDRGGPVDTSLEARIADVTGRFKKTAEVTADVTADAIKDALGDLDMSPIGTKIDQLRGLQETALSRIYKPDPYAMRNPEFFYNGEKIFKEGQDKIYDGLQRQIEKLEGLQASLGTLVAQGEQMPQTLVDALTAAGFSDIGQRIVAAITTTAAPSATPNPTAVQAPPSPNQFQGYGGRAGNFVSSGL